jgi:type IV pilus assembly PilX-like protein
MTINPRAKKEDIIRGERGVALILSLFLVTIMSVLAASLMFLSQTETYSTQNYRMMSQARYGAESGIHAAANYLLNGYLAVEPGTAGDPLTNYNTTTSPVKLVANNQPVILSASFPGVASNYPVAAVATAFNAAAQGTLAAGRITVGYAAYATLMSMQQQGTILVQTWQITANGTVGGARTATVQVSSTLDAQIIPGVGYAAFATGDGCGSIQFQGNASTASYDSSTYNVAVGGAPTGANGGVANSNGSVGTNGNLTDSGNATINGNLYTPRTGVGTCSNGGGGVAGDAQTQSGHADLTGTLVQLPQTVTMPTPAPPNPLPPAGSNLTINSGSTCASIGLAAPTCTGPGGNLTIDVSAGAVTFGNLNITAGANVTFKGSPAATSTPNVNINSISLTGHSTVNVQANTYVVMDVAGLDTSGNPLATPIDFTGGSTVTNSYDPRTLVIQYAGTGSVALSGTTSVSVVVDAPNAAVSLTGNGNIYGAIISASFTDTGNGTIYYDRNLTKSMFSTAGQPWLTSFSWQKS